MITCVSCVSCLSCVFFHKFFIFLHRGHPKSFDCAQDKWFDLAHHKLKFLNILNILNFLNIVFIIFIFVMFGMNGSTMLTENPSTSLRTSGSATLTMNGSAALTTSKVYDLSPRGSGDASRTLRDEPGGHGISPR